MPYYQPHQYGDAKPVVTKAVPSATVIEPGYLIGLSSNDPFPAASQAWNTDLATTQSDFVALFLGVSMEKSRSGDVKPIRVNTHGVHVFKCAAATFELGTLVGPAKDTGNALLSDTVVAVATEARAIGRIAKRYASNTTEVYVDVLPSLTKERVT